MKSEDETINRFDKTPCCHPEIDADLLRTVLYGKSTSTSLNDTDELIKKHHLSEDVFRTMPKQVSLRPSSIPYEPLGVFAAAWIKEGTEMGPFLGRLRRTEEVDGSVENKWMWEVLDRHGRVSRYVDAAEQPYRCWITYVQCARNDQEQNLEVVQIADNIYYRATKLIPPDQELLVWYSSSQPCYLGIPEVEISHDSAPDTVKEEHDPGSSSASTAPSAAATAAAATICSRLKCQVCRRGFNSRSNLRSHMRIHTLEKPFACKYCQRRFSQSSTLRNHVRLHTGEKPYKCLVCHSAYSQLAGLRAHQKSARHRPSASQPQLPVPGAGGSTSTEAKSVVASAAQSTTGSSPPAMSSCTNRERPSSPDCAKNKPSSAAAVGGAGVAPTPPTHSPQCAISGQLSNFGGMKFVEGGSGVGGGSHGGSLHFGASSSIVSHVRHVAMLQAQHHHHASIRHAHAMSLATPSLLSLVMPVMTSPQISPQSSFSFQREPLPLVTSHR